MAYKIKFAGKSEKGLKKLGSVAQMRIIDYLSDIALLDSPYIRGEPLHENLGGLWRYRIGNYRVICEINDNENTITVLDAGHRRDIYNIK